MNNFRVLSVSNFDPKSPAFHGRRVIRYKSRDGCQMCKAKKVKVSKGSAPPRVLKAILMNGYSATRPSLYV
jgi:hypothetical protein